MAEGQIKITITGNVGEKDLGAGDGGSPKPITPDADSKGKGDKDDKDTLFFIFAQQMYQQAQRIGTRAINNVGNLTGDYILQSRVNNTLSAISFFGGLVVAAKLGPVGLAVWGISTAVDEGLKQYEFALNQEKARIQKEYLANKNGQALRDNSRGGF
jgi:hypothetical protein